MIYQKNFTNNKKSAAKHLWFSDSQFDRVRVRQCNLDRHIRTWPRAKQIMIN